jgi:hypothetical protein
LFKFHIQGGKMNHRVLLVALFVVCVLTSSVMIADAQGPTPRNPRAPRADVGTGFTYQGQLKNGGALVNATCDFRFGLWDAASGDAQVGLTQSLTSTVTNGLFTVELNVSGQITSGTAFNGDARWLASAVACPSGGALTALNPRQKLTPAPMAFALPGLYTYQNTTSPNLIGGYSGNVISNTVVGGTIGGGGTSGNPNRVWGNYATVGGGANNTASELYAMVGGGQTNTASNLNTTVGGGLYNTASGYIATIGGGINNAASGQYATIGGGFYNTASGIGSFVGGGGYDGTYSQGNIAAGKASTIGGGISNTIPISTAAYAFIGGGYSNTATQQQATVGGGWYNTASGAGATVPGGGGNTAAGNYSFAAGSSAKALHDGTFVWSDLTYSDFNSTANNQFLIRASGGITLYTDSGATMGAALQPGASSWSVVSDRNLKANVVAVNAHDILVRLSTIPIQTWNYQTQDPSIRHIGPMAQDFYAAFNVGEDDRHITTIDADGVALAAIQGLYQVVQEKDAEIAGLRTHVASQQKQIDTLEPRLAALEQVARANNPSPDSGNIPTTGVLLGGLVVFGVVAARRKA